MNLLQKEGVPCGAVIDEGEAFHDPHLAARSFFQEVNHPEAGAHLHVGPLWKMSKTPMSITKPAPCLGEHNDYVYGELLGYSQQEIAELECEKYLGTEFVAQSGRI